jgi:hypothetical protein
MTRRLAILLMIAAGLGLGVFVFHLLTRPTPGAVRTLVIHAVDGQTLQPVPLLIGGPLYATADPWQRQVTRISRDTIQIRWVERATPKHALLPPALITCF